MNSVRLSLSRDTWRCMLVELNATERDLREMPEERTLRRARETLTKWEYVLFADELKKRRSWDAA
jgi:hypothetical protein